MLTTAVLSVVCAATVYCQVVKPIVPHRTSEDEYLDPCKARAYMGDIALTDDEIREMAKPYKPQINASDIIDIYGLQIEDIGIHRKYISTKEATKPRGKKFPLKHTKLHKNKKAKRQRCKKPRKCKKGSRDKTCRAIRLKEKQQLRECRERKLRDRAKEKAILEKKYNQHKKRIENKNLHDRVRRAATGKPERLWDYGVIPYEIDANFSASHKALFKLAMRHWENYTCITFVEKEVTQLNYILFTDGRCGCCSFVGKRGTGAQVISIGKNCDKFGIVVHEIGHVIGFWHEHTRPDRDQHVQIIYKNIMAGQEYNFNELSPQDVNSLGETYDYGSIMHYARNTFAKATYVDTILPIRKSGQLVRPEIGQRVRLSPGDIRQANKLYRCPACGRTLQDSNGIFSHTPTSTADHQAICQWRISATHGEKIVLNITTLDIPESRNCETDHLVIHDGYYVLSPVMGKYCGDKLPGTLVSSDSRMWLEYKSSKGHGKGFVAEYEAICGGEINKEHGQLTSPNYPDDYKPLKECVWKIKVPETFSVALKFQSFEIENHDECIYDYLEIRDGYDKSAPLIGQYCGYRLPDDVQSTGNELYVKFKSDGSVQKAGFAAAFTKEYDECMTDNHGCDHECVNTLGSFKCACQIGYELHSDGKKCEDACGGYIEAANGTIQSPSFPDLYPPNKNCVWQIVAPEQYRITLNFTHFDMEGSNQNCEYDSIEVKSGMVQDGTSHGVFCGSTLPLAITSETNTLKIEFNSDNSVQKTGFKAVFFTDKDECAIDNGGCDHICKNTQGSYQCACHNGYTLHENLLDCKEGGCKHNIDDPTGKIDSPNYPDFYPSRKDCVWLLTGTPGHRIKITFVDFELEPHQECLYDNIQLFDGLDDNARLLGKFCGSKKPPEVESSMNKMYIVFFSDASVQRKGFQATHSTVCGGHLQATATNQNLYSHAKYGDQKYDNKADCEWVIEAEPGYHARIEFLAFEIEEETECGYDYVEVYNGSPDQNVLLMRICSNEVPAEIISTGRSLVLIFRSDDTINDKGFSAVYSQVDPDTIPSVVQQLVIPQVI